MILNNYRALYSRFGTTCLRRPTGIRSSIILETRQHRVKSICCACGSIYPVENRPRPTTRIRQLTTAKIGKESSWGGLTNFKDRVGFALTFPIPSPQAQHAVDVCKISKRTTWNYFDIGPRLLCASRNQLVSLGPVHRSVVKRRFCSMFGANDLSLLMSKNCGLPGHNNSLNHCKISSTGTSNQHGKLPTQNNVKMDSEVRNRKEWRALLTVPNFLTITRMALTPYLGYLVLLESYQLACGIFMLAGITDLLDGWVARRFPGQSSPVGSFLDPLADKFLITTLFVTLSMVHLIPVSLTALVVSRDISLIAAAFYVRIISLPSPVTLTAVFNPSRQTAELKPTLISKLNTVVQLGLVVATLSAPVFDFVDHMALHALWYTTAGTTVLSGIGYIFAKGTFNVFKPKKQKP